MLVGALVVAGAGAAVVLGGPQTVVDRLGGGPDDGRPVAATLDDVATRAGLPRDVSVTRLTGPAATDACAGGWLRDPARFRAAEATRVTPPVGSAPGGAGLLVCRFPDGVPALAGGGAVPGTAWQLATPSAAGADFEQVAVAVADDGQALAVLTVAGSEVSGSGRLRAACRALDADSLDRLVRAVESAG